MTPVPAPPYRAERRRPAIGWCQIDAELASNPSISVLQVHLGESTILRLPSPAVPGTVRTARLFCGRPSRLYSAYFRSTSHTELHVRWAALAYALRQIPPGPHHRSATRRSAARSLTSRELPPLCLPGVMSPHRRCLWQPNRIETKPKTLVAEMSGPDLSRFVRKEP